MRYAEEAYVCTFKDVARHGWEVTWNGSCSDGSTSTPTHLIATENAGHLSLSFNGNPGWTALKRCNVKSSSVTTAPVDRVALDYVKLGGDSPMAREYWPDAVQTISSTDGASQLASRLSIYFADAGEYQFAMASSTYSCGTGAHGCPLVIIRDYEVIAEISACQDETSHSVSADGSRFFDCDNRNEGRLISSLVN
jgi:hypothetical protein